MGRAITADSAFVLVGTIGVLIQRAILRTSIELTSGPFSGAIKTVAALPELSVAAGYAFILISA